MPQGTSCSTTQTIDYYNENAAKFANSTVDIEFSNIQDRFASLLQKGASILDFGCGSGRDAKSFIDAGFSVTAIDGSAELCAIASNHAGIPVRNELFQELSDINAYDGIWACSSILHLQKEELIDVFRRIARALTNEGIIYTSFKYSEFEGYRNGRWFTDFTESSFNDFIKAIPELRLIDSWITTDARPEREDEQWLNLILKKA